MPRCTGKTKTGERCRASAITGLKRCSRHTLSKRIAKRKEITKRLKEIRKRKPKKKR